MVPGWLIPLIFSLRIDYTTTMRALQMEAVPPCTALRGTGLATRPTGTQTSCFIITDYQDRHLGSLETINVVEREIVANNASFSNHWATTAQYCPSRTSILRSQQAHNTIIINVKASRGNYN